MNITRTLTTAALLSTLTPPAVASASVQAGWDACPPDRFCVWDGPDGTGRMAFYTNGSENVTGQGLRALGRSGWNRTQSSWCTWDSTNTLTAINAGIRRNANIIALSRPHTWRCPF